MVEEISSPILQHYDILKILAIVCVKGAHLKNYFKLTFAIKYFLIHYANIVRMTSQGSKNGLYYT